MAQPTWLGARWDLIDLQISQRLGSVSGSLLEDGALRLRAGDNFKLAVLFLDGTDTVINPQPSQLRWSLRDAANLELISSVSIASPVAQTDEADPYFLVAPNVARLGAAARELLEQDAKDLPCVMDVDWVVGGKAYSSKTVPTIVEFGLSSQSSAAAPVASPPSTSTQTPATPTTPSPPQPPPPLPPPSLDGGAIRALFDQWLTEVLPAGEGLLYVRDGQIVDAQPLPKPLPTGEGFLYMRNQNVIAALPDFSVESENFQRFFERTARS